MKILFRRNIWKACVLCLLYCINILYKNTAYESFFWRVNTKSVIYASYIFDRNLSNYDTPAGFYFQYRPNGVACSVGEFLEYTNDANGDSTTGDFGWICASAGGGSTFSLDAADGSPTDVVYVDNDGNVGIGTTVPNAELDVVGDVIFQSMNAEGFVKNTATGLLSGGNTIGGGDISGFTQGSIPFAGASGLIEDNAGLFWDSVNQFLGVGTASPGAQIVVGDDVGRSFVSGIGDVFIANDLEIGGTLYGSVLGLQLGNDLDLDGNQMLNTRIENIAVPPACVAGWEGRLYFNTANSQTYVCNGSSWVQLDSTITSGALAAVQIRRTTTFSLAAAGTWYDVPFNTTDVENTPGILEHNNTNTERVDVKDDGLYQITYRFRANDGGTTHTILSRLQLNGASVINGSLSGETNYQNEFGVVQATVLAQLTANDYVTLQVQRSTNNQIEADALLSVIKLEGVKGDPGPAGADGVDGAPGGTTVDIQENDVVISNDIAILNFEGAASVIDEGGNKVTVTWISPFASGEMSAVQARRTTTFTLPALNTWYDIPLNVTDLENNTAVLEHNNTNTERIDAKEAGLYQITYRVRANDGGTTHTVNTRVQLNGSTVLAPSLAGETNYQNEFGTILNTFLVQLSANDYLTLQAQRTTANQIEAEALFSVVKMEGV